MPIKSIVSSREDKRIVLRCPYCWLGYVMPADDMKLKEKVAAKADRHLREHPEYVEKEE